MCEPKTRLDLRAPAAVVGLAITVSALSSIEVPATLATAGLIMIITAAVLTLTIATAVVVMVIKARRPLPTGRPGPATRRAVAAPARRAIAGERAALPAARACRGELSEREHETATRRSTSTMHSPGRP